MQPFTNYEINQYMKIDYYSKRNLELTESIRGKGSKGTLLWLLDETATAMGGRMLKQWIDQATDQSNQRLTSGLSLVETLDESLF